MDRARDDLQTADQRLTEIARILAGAVLRLCRRGSQPAAAQRTGPQILPESRANGLELPDETRLTVHRS